VTWTARVPDVGDMVHYRDQQEGVAGGRVCRPAIVVHVHGRAEDPLTREAVGPWDVDLMLVHPTRLVAKSHVIQDEARHGVSGFWHWKTEVVPC
jgi:hypothetical protein